MHFFIPNWLVMGNLFNILTCSLLLNTTDKLAITATPRVILVNQAVRLTCHVPRRPDNRLLTYGLTNYLESERNLEGEHAPITTQVLFKGVPCEVTAAYCRVTRSGGSHEQAVMSLKIAGCD